MSHELRATSFHEGSYDPRLPGLARRRIRMCMYGVYTASAGSAGTPAPGVFQYTTSIGPHGRDTHAPRARAPEALRNRMIAAPSAADRRPAVCHLAPIDRTIETHDPRPHPHCAPCVADATSHGHDHAPDMQMHRTCKDACTQGTMRLCPTRRPTCDCNVQGAMLCLVMCIVHSTPRMHLPESYRKHLAPPWCLEPCAQHGAQSHPIPQN